MKAKKYQEIVGNPMMEGLRSGLSITEHREMTLTDWDRWYETTKALLDMAAKMANYQGLPIIPLSADCEVRVISLGTIAPHAMDYDSGMEAQWQEAKHASS